MKTTEYYIYELDDSPLFIYTEKSEFSSQTKEYFSGMPFKVKPEGVELFHGDVFLPAENKLREVEKEVFIKEATKFLDNMESYGAYLRYKLNDLHKKYLNHPGRASKKVIANRKTRRESYSVPKRASSRN